MSTASSNLSFLVRLTDSIKTSLEKPELLTVDFVEICNQLIPVFDNLGSVFSFARKEFSSKNESLERVQNKLVTLKQLVDADKQTHTVTIKDSRARNLHRLGSALMFLTILMKELMKSITIPLKDAAHVAYQEALAPIHTKILQGIIVAGLYALPRREVFLERIKETEETAEENVAIFVPFVDELVKKIHALYDEPMLVSKTWFISK